MHYLLFDLISVKIISYRKVYFDKFWSIKANIFKFTEDKKIGIHYKINKHIKLLILNVRKVTIKRNSLKTKI